MENKAFEKYLDYIKQLPVKPGESVYIISNMAPVLYTEIKAGRKPYLSQFIDELKNIFNNEERPVFVACDENDAVVGYMI